jgi:ATP-dependent RNA helicase DeaD
VTESETSTLDTSTGFGQLKLSSTMLAALDAAGYSEPTPVQAGLIPRALEGIDVLGQARTGTGKTAAFAIPIIEQIELGKKNSGPQAIVLVPTRELAVQVREEFVKLGHGRKIHSVAVYGGKPIRGQIDKLQRGVEVVIGTPGRVLDHLARGTLQLRDLKIVVLDEADRMLDIGFRPDIEKILRRCPQSRQTLLLSATVAPPIERLAQRYMRDPETLNFSPKDVAVETIEQFYFTVDGTRKFELLEKLLQREQPRQAIVFCRTKRGTERVYQRLSKKFPEAATIHGDLHQGARDRVMSGFRAGEIRYLVATDVVGRGIDVSNISHIINYDIPQFCDDYVHRVGRTGRMGREGVAYTFVSPEEGNELTRIEIRINRLLKRGEMPGFSAVESDRPAAVPASTGPAEWRPGGGWGDGAPTATAPANPPASNAPVAPEQAQTPEAPAQSPPSKTPSKRYRRAL